MRSRRLYLEAALVALATILLEVSYTRVFSFKLVYYFTYLIIGIALLGLGAGGVFVAIFPRLRRAPIERLLPTLLFAAAASVLGGYGIVSVTQLNAFDLIGNTAPAGGFALELGKLIAICLCVFLPFLCAGLVLAVLFATRTYDIARLYFADLTGAAVGCALIIPLLGWLTPPGSVLLAGAFFAAAGLRLASAGSRAWLLALGALAASLLTLALSPSLLPDPVPDRVKQMAPQQLAGIRPLLSRWSPVFRVDVLPGDDQRMFAHDGLLGSAMHRYDGNPRSLARFDRDDRQIPFRLLPPAPKVAIVGAAGGRQILASLYFGASHITGIELNPVTWSLVHHELADFGGHLAQNPKVSYLNAEGRSFLKASSEHFDLIWLVSPDSYAAMNAATSGAFVLSESYLYTQEMIFENLERLSDDGIVCVQIGEVDFANKPNRTLRYLATARAAFERRGVHDFGAHVLVSKAPGFAGFTLVTIVLKKQPFSDEQREAFAAAVARVPNGVVLHDGVQALEQPVNRVISLPDDALARWLADWPFEVHAISDDSPFFWHFVPFRDALASLTALDQPNPEEGLGERLVLMLLLVALIFAAVFLLAPFYAIRDVWREIPYKGWAALYFAALGMGFMFLEVSLIQRLTLFLGYPTYSLTVTLFALLWSTGVGSFASERLLARRDRSLLIVAAALAALVAIYPSLLGWLAQHGVGWPFAARVAITIAALAPLGLCLGAMMPLGLRSVSASTTHPQEFVAWSWAVNGFFSVLSSVLATILSMTLGFDWVMRCALLVYAIGIAALLRIPAPRAP